MDNKLAKLELEQIYGSLSPNKQQALDVAFKAMEQENICDAVIGWLKEEDIIKVSWQEETARKSLREYLTKARTDCDTCKHNDKSWEEEPCDGCCGNSGYEQADGESCVTCKNNDTYHCADCENKSDYEQAQADGEYISRQDVINMVMDNDLDHIQAKDGTEIIQLVEQLPSVAIPNKAGHWIGMYEPKNMVVCSECGKCAYLYNNRTSTYCPHCGCSMEIER